MRRYRLAVLGLWLSCLLCGGAQAAEPIFLQPHRAVYDLTLARADEGADVDGLTGRMVYEYKGAPCKGYTTRFRFVTRIENGDGERVTDLRTTNFETADGRSFRFTNKTLVNGETAQDVEGSATENGKGTLVDLTRPKARTVRLDPAKFPTTHMLDIISRAETGEHFYQTTIFDGSDDADKVMATTVVIGKEESGPETDAEGKVMGAGGGGKRWPVSIAYFDESSDAQGLPTFRTTFKLYENGITRDLMMDYGNFAINAKLIDLKLYGRPDCLR